ncbi:hypothetical protein BK670_09205 [Pseudomonas fluorescens]|uniref:Uncharacterized protein n=2 Tax=Pseudomonas fluorescens TaxID=294 RepID=A0A423MFY5_PSEFL|nr:hypothetical protein BK670_09205 [Pseudomonas fluorescens]
MTKPPKPPTGNRIPDTSTTTRPAQDQRSIHPNNPMTGPLIDLLPESSPPATSGRDTVPQVIVTYITDPVTNELNAKLREISWPALQSHLLQPHASVDGLFFSPEGHLYAHLGEGGYYRAEQNINGDLQIPWPAAPGVTPPLLKKIDGQPRWRLEADWYTRPLTSETRLPPVQAPAPPSQTSLFLPPHLAALLTSDPDTTTGIRHDKHKNAYVNMAEGTAMVRRNNNGQFELAWAGQRPTGDLVEQIPGTLLWRRKAGDARQPDHRQPATTSDEPTAGPSKRPRLEAEPDTTGPSVPVLPAVDWHTWGSATKPLAGNSIEIDGQHYPIVPQSGHATDNLVFITHPRFSAEDFDAFEQVLRATPQLQPKGTVKLREKWGLPVNDKWEVIAGLPFKNTLTQYVNDTFPYMADHSANAVARAMFNRANRADTLHEYAPDTLPHLPNESALGVARTLQHHANRAATLNGYGLNDLFETFQYWAIRSQNRRDEKIGRHDLVDPLLFLPSLSRAGGGHIPKPSGFAEGLQCIDFDLQRVPLHLRESHEVRGRKLRTLFQHILTEQGYQVSHSFRDSTTQQDALMFQRQGVDLVFILRFPILKQGNYPDLDTKNWLRTKALVNKHEPSDKVLLNTALAENKIVYLMGGLETEASGQSRLFVLRHK